MLDDHGSARGPGSSLPGALLPTIRCQYEGLPLRPIAPLGLLRPGRLLRERFRQRFSPAPTPGAASVYQVGDWVRIKDADTVRATLDQDNRLHGLWFTDGQWPFCEGVYQVDHVTRLMMDDHYRMRRVSRTVSLAGVTCAGPDGDQGCGLACALLFRDDWLEPAAAPQRPGRPDAPAATIRSLAEIQATLDAHGTLDGVPFHPAMADYAGTRHTEPIAVEHHALPGWIRPSGEQWYLFDSLRCNGEPVEGGCDRRCALLWHKSWLNLDDANTPAAPEPTAADAAA
ncbi:MAG TPA: hypothetical protein VGX23_21790 [Actinocrinis sp.]|nr:hypothetical protein [Actinocrinis sp.]